MSFRCRLFLSLNTLFFALCLPIQQPQALDKPQSEDAARSLSKINSKVKFSFGYDNNVSETIEDRIESRFYQLYFNSGMYVLPTEKTLISLRLQDGFKYLDSPSLFDESVMINHLNLYLSHRISNWLAPEIQSEIMGRTSIHSETDVLPSEEAFLRGSAGLALKSIIYDDISLRASYSYRFINFEDFDPFDRRGPAIELKADIRLLPGSNAGVQYTRENSQYNKWYIISEDGEIKRLDKVDDISVFTQFYKYYLFDIRLSHERNESDINGYSYRANKISLLMAKTFPEDIVFQLHGHIRFKKYLSEPQGTESPQIDLEDDERGLLTVNLSKEINQYCGLEAQYDFRRNKSSTEDDFYSKNIFSLSLLLQF